MDKYGRNYVLDVETPSHGTLRITLPFTLEFDITRNTLSSANVCQLRIHNLSLLNRNQIRFNTFEYSIFRAVKLRAGYGSNLAEIFTGNISQAWSVREGTDFITQIECYDGGFAFNNGTSDITFPSGTAQQTVVSTLMGDLPQVQRGVVGAYPGTLARGNTYSGNTANILKDVTGGGFFVDRGMANALGTNEYIATPTVLEINSQSGLLGTPVLERNIVRFDMLFEPRLNVGTLIKLTSVTEQNFNGFYKVTAVKHRGVISGAVAGAATTTGEFLKFGTQTGVAK